MSDSKDNKTKKIYLILSHTGTIFSNIIRIYTKEKYSHISISLDRELEKMYSFGRLKPYNPFKGGFVHEGIKTGTFKRFPNTKALIYELEVTNKQYDKLEAIINQMEQNKEEYKYNFLGIFGFLFDFKYQAEKAFYCAEFVKYVLEESKIVEELPKLMIPSDFLTLNDLILVYKGLLRRYHLKLKNDNKKKK